MTAPLETARLLLRPLAAADAGQLQVIFPQWEIVRYLFHTVPWPYPTDGASAFCRAALESIERGGRWAWTLRLKAEPDRIIGVIELTTDADNNRGFWLDPRWQRRGLMTEACDVVTDYWFNALNFRVLRAPKALANIASRRISEKQGMRVVSLEERHYVSGRLPAELWEITADEWNARQAARDRIG